MFIWVPAIVCNTQTACETLPPSRTHHVDCNALYSVMNEVMNSNRDKLSFISLLPNTSSPTPSSPFESRYPNKNINIIFILILARARDREAEKQRNRINDLQKCTRTIVCAGTCHLSLLRSRKKLMPTLYNGRK